MVFYLQFHQIRMAGIGASQKEKDLSRLLHISGLFPFSQRLSTRFERSFYCRSTPYLGPMCAMTSKS